MTFNDVLVEAGGFGLYQKLLTFICLAFTLALVSFTYWTQVYILLIPPHRCKRSLNDTEWNPVFNQWDNSNENFWNGTQETNETNEVCEKGFVYDFSLHFPTYASEHDMVGEDAWKVYMCHTLYWTGTILGYVVFGIVNDRYGRRRAYQCSIILSLLAEVLTYFCETHISFLVARFFAAAGEGSIATIAFVLTIEHCIPSKRRLVIFVWSFAYALSSLSVVWVAYICQHWRTILMISWIPISAGVFMSYFLPESSSWLITKGRVNEAVFYIQKMAKMNGKSLNKDYIIHHLQKTDKSEKKDQLSFYQTFRAVVKSPNLRKRIIILAVLWLISCGCYNGNSLAMSYLPFSMYITYSIGALTEIPGNILSMAALDRLGRRWTNSGFFFAGGVLGILSASMESKTGILVLAMIMRTCFGSAFDITFSYANEVVPTVIRGRALSFVRICGGLGSALAPFVVNLAENDTLLPLRYFGIAAVLAGCLMLTMPETAKQHLPQTLEEGEDFGKDNKFWACPCMMNSSENGKESPHENSIFGSITNPAFEADDNEVKCIGIKKHLKY